MTPILRVILVILAALGTAWGSSAGSAPAEPARQVTCSGKVINSAGEPVADAKVRLHKLTVNPEAFTYDMALAQELTTTEDGSFTLKTEASKDEMSGQTIILVEKDGLALGWANWQLNENTDVEIKLDRPQVMAGKVVDDAGKPVSDAEVNIAFMIVMSNGQPRYLVSAESLGALTTRTDAEGRFSFGRIPIEASAEFMVKKPSRATVSTFNPENYQGQALQFSSGQTDIEIALGPEARIEGIVVEKATGKPASGIRIMATRGRNQPNFGLKPIASGEDGRFVIDALGAGAHTLRVVTPSGKEAEWIAESVEVVTEAGKTSSGVKVELSKGGLLEVVVAEAATKKPVQEARVSVQNQSRNEHFGAVSDSNGTARLRLIPGEYQISGVYRDGFARQNRQESVTIEDGKTTRLELEITAQPRISGVVRDEQGKPVLGAKLQVCPMGTGQNVSSDAEGKFEISWDPGRWHSAELPAMILVARYERGNLACTVEVSEETRVQDITLRPAVALSGKVVDPNGKGIAEAQITTMLQGPKWGSSIKGGPANANKDGSFEIRTLPSENSYVLNTRAEGYGENRSEAFNAGDAVNGKLDVGSIMLAVADLSISGVVLDTQGKPVAGVRVYCYGDNQPHRNAQTDTDGKFTLDGVCAGKVRVSASKSGAARLYGNVETEGGVADVRIVISESPSSTRYVPKLAPSLLGKPLPDLKDVKIDLPPADLTGKMLLVCFFDMEQRPSRNYLRQVNTMAKKLATQNVVVVAVQASQMDEDSLDNWLKKYSVSIPIGMVQGDGEKTKFAWGVRSLPWLILTDSKHVVSAGGFGLTELNANIEAAK
jgi:protocatechuate 3,4-dioxygenase beta subunit